MTLPLSVFLHASVDWFIRLSVGSKYSQSTPKTAFVVLASYDLAINNVHPFLTILSGEQLGISTADGTLGLSGADHLHRFFSEPAVHCKGYGNMGEQ